MKDEIEQLRRERDELKQRLAAHEQDEAIAKDIAKDLQTALARNITDRLPLELAPDTDDLPSALTALTRLKTERNNAMVERDQLAAHCEHIKMQALELATLVECNGDFADVAFDLLNLANSTPAHSLAVIKADANKELSAHCERLREAVHDARFLLENPSTQAHENRVLEHLVSVMDATPAHSLAAIKAQVYDDGQPAQKAFWEGFQRGAVQVQRNIRTNWNEYKVRQLEADA